MTSKGLISIIVPVYNVEQYLDQCVQSIVEQTYSNIEIILVDDGSTDNCPAMCNSWAEKDTRVKVIHKTNGGLSDARNAGLAVAKGEYVGFIDSDDYISKDMYELLLNSILDNNSDISICGIQLFWEDGTEPKMLSADGSYVLNKEEALLSVINESLIKQPVVYKLYKYNLIKDLLFPVGKYHEDVFWTYLAVARAENISIFDNPCYFYRQRNNSIMNSSYSLKRLDGLEAVYLRTSFIQKNIPALANAAKSSLWFSCIYTMQMVTKHCSKEDMRTAKSFVNNYLDMFPIRSVFKINITFKQRVWLLLARISFTLCYKLRNLLGIGF